MINLNKLFRSSMKEI